MNRWIEIIATMILVKQEIQKYDKEELWDYYLPEGAASEDDIIRTESLLGFFIDSNYKEFLKHADGWKGFYQSVDLFGTNELYNSSEMNYANTILDAIEESVLESSGLMRDQLLPIAATSIDRDLFVITKSTSSNQGIVIWFAGDEIDRFESFTEFFLAMVDYNREELKYFKSL
ncbi:SMI1/KNR4 family protein [Solibacillus sp. FSL K6-1523]|uniref:SMI1/KNR4 family protein n=1 Tax=Solibacillus sp. FSL K6-1523 TaxID=2921471 RepID=UPI0030F6BE8E